MKVEEGKIYKHFKGNFYKVEGVALDCESEERVVVYRALYGKRLLFVRKYADFVGILNKDKYPQAKQIHRFERASKEEFLKWRNNILKEEDKEKGF